MNLEALAADLETERGLRWLWVGVWVLFALAMGACMSNGADTPADPTLQDSARIPGFAETSFKVTPASGKAAARCAALADTPQTWTQGLTGRSDLGGYDGMVFVFTEDRDGTFHMTNVPLPLSIAWFDASGTFVSAADMAPCLGQATCPRYSATAPYRYALETTQGNLSNLGVGPGSVISVGGSCTG